MKQAEVKRNLLRATKRQIEVSTDMLRAKRQAEVKTDELRAKRQK